MTNTTQNTTSPNTLTSNTTPQKITIVCGTDRPGSKSRLVTDYIYGRLADQASNADTTSQAMELTILDMADFPTADVAAGPYGKTPSSVEAFNQPFLDADGVIFVIPEYNGSFPGILKLFIDYLPHPEALQGVPVGYVGNSAGYFGGLRAVEQLQMVCGYRYARSFEERIFIPAVNKEFDPEKGILHDFRNSLMESFLEQFPRFVAQNTTK
ncbi:MAG: NAD(P)H-dependent oxidoreductase [Balneolaceae bacterium]|nr:NAD(P)H-dependent oxidoreductase [Balneolaceae bacterium]